MRTTSTEFDDPAFLDRLRHGDAEAYRRLIRRFHASLVSVAASVIGSHAQAEEVVQDAWLAVFSGIGRFEGRAAIGTWLFSIVLNRARTRRGREVRLVALPAEARRWRRCGALQSRRSLAGVSAAVGRVGPRTPGSRPPVVGPRSGLRSLGCRPASAPSSPCATSRARTRKPPAICWTSAPKTNVCCSTVRE